ncbi:hypothetical protein [Ruania rhizosphaerae]|uniref:hypothetical protein n=1 Tax=Ruania rhizosphaerae TaxID=1840413 RepID=UPI00135C07E4|nr:hypothetical protein [Ruania rhizosphaerae]
MTALIPSLGPDQYAHTTLAAYARHEAEQQPEPTGDHDPVDADAPDPDRYLTETDLTPPRCPDCGRTHGPAEHLCEAAGGSLVLGERRSWT